MLTGLGATFVAEVRKLAYVGGPNHCRLWLLFLIPGINVVAPIVWMAVGAWMLAVTYVDYPMANHGNDFDELRARCARGVC